MLKFALKNMRIKRTKILLVILSIVISACVGLLAYNVSQQVSDGIVSTAAYYDMIIGPSGSATQLAMNTMFFTDAPLGTIPYSYAEELQRSGKTNAVVPFAMGDSYNSARIIGTTPAFLEGKELASGEMFADNYECVIGSAVAEANRLKTGDAIITSHGLAENGSEHAASPFTVTGILKKTNTAYDNAVFTSYKTVWAVHGAETHEDGEEEEEAEATEGSVCAILVKTKSFNDYYALESYYGENANLLVINPSTVLREVLNNVDLSSKIVYLLCAVILIMNIFVITVITLLNMYDSRGEIALMRLIGIGMGRISLLYMLQNALMGLAAALISMLAAHLLLGAMGSFVASMGIVLDSAKIYPAEWIILLAVFVISVLPTLICTLRMARRDGMES